MVPLHIVILLLFLHLVADFFFQSDWMALNKSKRWDALALHAGVYSLFFLAFGADFWLITFLTHAATDAITSRITSWLWFLPMEQRKDGQWYAYPVFWKRHWFFVAIGCDQFIHYVTLLTTYKLLF